MFLRLFPTGVALEELADLVEEHNGDSFDILAAFCPDGNEECPQRGKCHQEVFIKYTTV